MTACEKCWSEYRRRQLSEPNVTYSQVVAESDARGGCTPAESCGDLHLLGLPDAEGIARCRCGAVAMPVPGGDAE